jgi:hypothetical protein
MDAMEGAADSHSFGEKHEKLSALYGQYLTDRAYLRVMELRVSNLQDQLDI